jgi:hypothetical protein
MRISLTSGAVRRRRSVTGSPPAFRRVGRLIGDSSSSAVVTEIARGSFDEQLEELGAQLDRVREYI